MTININDNIKISVVIPTKDRPTIVLRAVMSVLKQTYNEFEVIVVIDGPDDSTVKALNEINDTRLTYLELPNNVGGSDARNAGVSAAKGEWIAFLDDDDEWHPEKLTKQMEAANRLHNIYPIITCCIVARTPRGEFIWPRRLPRQFEPINEYLFVRKSFFQAEGLLPTSTWLVRKELMELVPFRSGLKKHQDWDWVLRVANIEGVCFEIVPEPLASYYLEEQRIHVGSVPMWMYSLEWLRLNRNLVSPKSYSCFVATQVVPQAAGRREWKAFFPLLWEMFHNGSPRAFDLALFLGMWFMPQNIRRGFRSVFKKDSGKLIPRQMGIMP